MRQTLFVILLLFSSLVRAHDSELVKKMRLATIEHRTRLKYAALALIEQFPTRFVHLRSNKALVLQYLDHKHDTVKLMDQWRLSSEFGYQYSEDVITRLSKYFGKSIDELSAADRREFVEFRDGFNSIEDKIAQEFLDFYGLSSDSPFVMELRDLEIVIDVTDVGIFRREEVNAPLIAYNGERYLTKNNFPQDLAQMSRALEDLVTTPSAVRLTCVQFLSFEDLKKEKGPESIRPFAYFEDSTLLGLSQ